MRTLTGLLIFVLVLFSKLNAQIEYDYPSDTVVWKVVSWEKYTWDDDKNSHTYNRNYSMCDSLTILESDTTSFILNLNIDDTKVVLNFNECIKQIDSPVQTNYQCDLTVNLNDLSSEPVDLYIIDEINNEFSDSQNYKLLLLIFSSYDENLKVYRTLNRLYLNRNY